MKRADNLAPVYELSGSKHKFKEALTPVNDSKGLIRLESTSPDARVSDRPVYSQSVDLFQRKSRGSTIVRRRMFMLHEKSDPTIARKWSFINMCCYKTVFVKISLQSTVYSKVMSMYKWTSPFTLETLFIFFLFGVINNYLWDWKK